MSTSNRSMALPQHRRRYLFPTSSSSLLHPSPFPSPPPTETPLSPLASSHSSSRPYHPNNHSATLSWVNNQHQPFFLESVSSMEEIHRAYNDASATGRVQQLRTSASDESFRKIRSSMAVSAVLNPASSTPPDSMSQTSEMYPLGNFDSTTFEPTTFDSPSEELQRPASPPQTPPQRYMSHHERHQQRIQETLKLETARCNQETSRQPIKQEATSEDIIDMGKKVSPKSSSQKRASKRPSVSGSPEPRRPTTEEIQPKIIRIKFKDQTLPVDLEPKLLGNGSSFKPNQLPVKRGRGRPRKVDSKTGEPLAKKPKVAGLDEAGEPVKKKRKIKSATSKLVPVANGSTPVEPMMPSREEEAKSSVEQSKKRKRRQSMDEATAYPHIQRKQKIVSSTEERIPRPPQHEHGQGLTNLGATCYVNVVVQVLAHTRLLRDYFLACDFARSSTLRKSGFKVKSHCTRRTREAEKALKDLIPKLKGKLGEEFGILIRALTFDEDERNGRKAESCIGSNQFWAALCANLQGADDMDPGRLQDAHEFLMLFLSSLASESNPVVDGYSLPEIIDNCFAGVHCTTFTCNNCKAVTRREDKCSELELPVCKTIPVDGKLVDANLDDILSRYILPEDQEWGSDSYTLEDGTKIKACPSCGVDKGRSMHNTIKPKGENVCIELKRFLWQDGENRKVRGHIKFPMRDLDLSVCGEEALPKPATTSENGKLNGDGEHITNGDEDTPNGDAERITNGDIATPSKTLYNLYGVVVHQGDTSITGHYYAFAKEGDQWFKFNDKIVTAVKEEEVEKEEAYLLLYEKRVTA